MKITGKVIKILPAQSGVNAAGNQWQKIEFVVEEMAANYPQSVCLIAFNDKVSQIATIPLGTVVNVEFDLRTREYNGRYYNDCRFFRFVADEPMAVSPQAQAPMQQQVQQQPAMQYSGFQAQPQNTQPQNNNLPF